MRFSKAYTEATAWANGVMVDQVPKMSFPTCPIESGFIHGLADLECGHGRLHGDRTPPCGCWGKEGKR